MSTSAAISPTAHYTGQVWFRNGLSHPQLATREGRVLFDALHPAVSLSRRLGGPSLETYLLARHRAIDALLRDAIQDHGITQVIEAAAGLSPRGWRFMTQYGDALTYVEADLPEMAERKRRALARIGTLGDRHRVEDLDALRNTGPCSLAAIADGLDHSQGLMIITEGLLGYLAPDAVDGLWRRFAATLTAFVMGRYLSDLHLGGAAIPTERAFRLLLSGFVRGRVYLHFDDATAAESALLARGFAEAWVRPAGGLVDTPGDPGSRLAHILEASTE